MTKSRLTVIALCILAGSTALQAQYIGDQQIGLTGLGAGSMPGPGFYINVPLYYRDSSISIYNPQGNQILKNISFDINVVVVPAVEVVTTYKVAGATYGAAYIEWITKG